MKLTAVFSRDDRLSLRVTSLGLITNETIFVSKEQGIFWETVQGRNGRRGSNRRYATTNERSVANAHGYITRTKRPRDMAVRILHSLQHEAYGSNAAR